LSNGDIMKRRNVDIRKVRKELRRVQRHLGKRIESIGEVVFGLESNCGRCNSEICCIYKKHKGNLDKIENDVKNEPNKILDYVSNLKDIVSEVVKRCNILRRGNCVVIERIENIFCMAIQHIKIDYVNCSIDDLYEITEKIIDM